MNRAAFEQSLASAAPPADLPLQLQSLWHLLRSNWAEAHRVVQEVETADVAWMHAHLHRVEGDLANAGYWYGKAGREAFSGELQEERAAMLDVWTTR